MKTIGKWIGGLMIFSILIALFSIISPIILIIGGLGIWYYTKKEPNPQKMKYSVVATVIGLFGSIFLLTSGGSDSESSADNNANTSTTTQTEPAKVSVPEAASSESVVAEVTAPEVASSESVIAEEPSIVEEPVATIPSEPVVAPAPAAPEVSREFRNALGSANDYLNFTSFSKSGLYDQLIYEGFPEDAVQYAVDNVVTDWNANALQTAIDYLDFSSFSDQGLYDQLIYEGYSAEQAQYAIDNLPG
ncbi:Ltp family lipoprotein [Trichococcus alkaliphilus]|uniref:Ltp family lipoprotein n=1 Tax=Trichococcus alkaliphilus TaxID=2052943 RepID=UPI000D0BA940|nr:Ltp family lipoprotein [Trichococcus alkaliphilus]